jgi:hypothetical protein
VPLSTRAARQRVGPGRNWAQGSPLEAVETAARAQASSLGACGGSPARVRSQRPVACYVLGLLICVSSFAVSYQAWRRTGSESEGQSHHPWRQLEQHAHDGDLFVYHLVREARPLIDPDSYLPKLRGVFEFRSTYQDEITRAIHFGWYLVRFGSQLNSRLLAKRALWCIRTILIAPSAERRDPVFAPQQLAEQTRSASARDLLGNRRRRHDDIVLCESLRQFLENEVPHDHALEHADRDSFMIKFAATSNKVALQTLRQGEKSHASYLG